MIDDGSVSEERDRADRAAGVGSVGRAFQTVTANPHVGAVRAREYPAPVCGVRGRGARGAGVAFRDGWGRVTLYARVFGENP